MNEIIFIGTLHAGLTPHDELQTVLEYYQPEQLLVEIRQTDIESSKLEKYPDEMCFAFVWAKNNNIPVFGFDTSIEVFAHGKTELDNQAVIHEQKEILKRYTWKDANTSKVINELNTPLAKNLTDNKKEREREQAMLQNILKIALPTKRVIVLTGAGHLDFFQQNFSNAVFPFRKLL